MLLRGMIYGLGPADALVAVLAVVLLAIAGMSAAGVPARSAARLDPVTAIHVE